jgi:hypothetical protein
METPTLGTAQLLYTLWPHSHGQQQAQSGSQDGQANAAFACHSPIMHFIRSNANVTHSSLNEPQTPPMYPSDTKPLQDANYNTCWALIAAISHLPASSAPARRLQAMAGATHHVQ